MGILLYLRSPELLTSIAKFIAVIFVLSVAIITNTAIKNINMKINFLTLLFTLITVLTFAQTSEHLSFKGVPIDGKLVEYVSKMKQNSFTHLQTENGTAILTGDFAGYKDCYVGVSTLKQKDLVYKIAVVFSEKDTWSKLSTNYFELKQMLTEKYGEPSDVVEKFDVESYAQPRDDEDRFYNVKSDNCKYYSVWKNDIGEIQLSIEHDSRRSCFINLAYFDKINGDIINQKAKDDL